MQAMEPSIVPLAATDAAAIARWRYDEPYAFYDPDRDPDDLAELRDPASWPGRYFAAHDAAGSLIGFFQFAQDRDVVTLGLGLRPDLTGQGFGVAFLRAGLDFARRHFAPRRFVLAVAAFNRRAIRVYEREGFRISCTFVQATNGGEYEFVEMIRPAEVAPPVQHP